MLFAKLHVLATVALTFAAALYAGRVPYFPIEISRTIATDPTAGFVFRSGIASVLGTMWFTNVLTKQTFALWVSLMVIAFFDDNKYWWTHMLGVAMLMIVSTYRVKEKGEEALVILTASFALFVFRILMKIVVVMMWELPHLHNESRFIDSVIGAYDGVMTATHRSAKSLLMFKLGGVLQWVVFWLVSDLF
jgi:hypothetical protein